METNPELKKKVVKNTTKKSKSASSDPFAAAVESNKKKSSLPANTAAAAPKVKSEQKFFKKTTSKKHDPVITDPFAEIAMKSSPVKKAVAKPTKAKTKAPKNDAKKISSDATKDITPTALNVEVSSVFKALADVSLPELKRENRARLQMQTPTRLYFYWSVKENPWALLKNVFGDDLGSYTLVVKLIDTKLGYEEINRCEAEGDWWFDVEPDHSYKAEIGFYAPNRPYFRLLHSNEIETPRRTPSPRIATDADWKVSANKFAEVLDVAGFSRDAFDVAMAGDDIPSAEYTSQVAFASMFGTHAPELESVSAEDLRHAMLALASGVSLEELRFRVSEKLFSILQANAKDLTAGKAMSALKEYFEIDETEFKEEHLGAAVYGASVMNFPKTLKTRSASSRYSPRYNPVSSHSLI